MSTTRIWNGSGQVNLFASGQFFGIGNNVLSLVSSSLTNAPAGGGNIILSGMTSARVTLWGIFGAAPSANTGMDVYLMTSEDGGTTYENITSGIKPARAPDCVIGLDASGGTTQQHVADIDLPPNDFVVYLYNDGTGQTLNSGKWSLRMMPYTDQGV